jgi:two-component system response regulator HydG
MKSVLIIDRDRTKRTAMKLLFTSHNLKCHEAKNEDQAVEILESQQVDVVMCNAILGRDNGLDVLSKIKGINEDMPVVMVAAHDNIRNAVEAIRRGASNYIIKNPTPDELVEAVFLALRSGSVKPVPRKKDPIKNHSGPKENYILSSSSSFQQILSSIDIVAPTNYSVLLFGESGTGKEAFAREIHKRSTRSSEIFHAIDCGTLSSELAGSALFGHEQGSFTGASKQQEGAFEIASGGTLFLDEVTNLGFDIQRSLLRVTQEQKVRRIGGTEEIPVDVRIIVASNVRLADAVKAGKFRADLFHRFNEFELCLLPLRERKEDIIFYARHFLSITNTELQKNVRQFSSASINQLLAYHWPGNLRELRNVVRRAVLVSEGDEISFVALPGQAEVPIVVDDARQVEIDYSSILAVLQRNGFNKVKAASTLKIDLKILGRRLRAFSEMKGFKLEF